MRVRSLRIDAFGGLSDTGLDDLPGGLVVLYGPNEAGKSTLLSFLRGALFGFPSGSTREAKFLPPGERRRGGRVELEESGRVLVVERSAPPPGKRKLDVRYGDGSEASERDLAHWLGHADAELYKNVFAFSLSELQGFESLGTTGIQERIFSAGITGAGRSARDALTRLETHAHELLSAGGRKGRVLELVATRRTLRLELERRREAARGYAALAERERETGSELERLREHVDAERSRAARAVKLVELWRDVWSPLLAARERLAKLEEIGGFPDDAKEKLRDLRERIDHFETRTADLRVEIGQFDRELESLEPSPALEAVADEVAEHERERAAHRDRIAARTDLARALAESETRLAVLVRDELGPGFDDERIAGFDASRSRLNEAGELAAQITAALAAEAKVEQRAARLSEEAVRLELRRERAALARDAIVVTAVEDLEARGAALRGMRDELAESRALERVREEREAALEELRAPHTAGWIAAGIASGLLAGAAAAALAFASGRTGAELSGWLAPIVATLPAGAQDWLALAARWPASLPLTTALGGVLAAALVLSGLNGLRRYRRALQLAEGRLAQSSDALAAREGRRVALLAALGLDALPDDEGLDRIELALRRERDRGAERAGHARSAHAYEEELVALRQEHDSLQPERDRLRVARERAERDVAVWRELRGVPEAVQIDQVPLHFETLRRARQLLESRDDARAALARCDDAIRDWERRAAALLALACEQPGEPGAAHAGEELARDFAELAARCVQDRTRRAQRTPLLKRRLAASERLEDAERRLDDKRAELHALLREGGAASEEEFRARLAVAEERAELEREIDRRELVLEQRLGRGREAAALRGELEQGRVGEWEEQAARASGRVRELEEGRDEAVRAHRDLANAVAELGASADVASTELELAQLGEELAREVETWRRLRLARGLVRETLARFERERQPEVLRDASELFARVTHGRYARVEQTAETESFVVVDRAGGRRELGELSRGTAEQLYLCVRLGLIEEFARRSVSLPVAMDDVLVNFDDARASATARVLAEFAAREGRQLLFFTCSTRTRDLLCSTTRGASAIDLSPAS